MRRQLILAIFASVLALGLARGALAHHSFAVFFDSEKAVTVKGTVTDFQFRNPHGIIRMSVRDAKGVEQVWKAETNSPSVLERRGWTRESLMPGETITVEGWPARDGSNYMRMRRATRADGKVIGTPTGATEQK